jgi:hypothetical protein
MLDKPSTFDAREVNRKALKHWSVLAHMIYDFNGRALGEIAQLNENYVQQDPGRRRQAGPRLIELRGPSSWDGGSWHCLGGDGARGDDVISLVQYLGECDYRTAADFLKNLTDRLVEIAD